MIYEIKELKLNKKFKNGLNEIFAHIRFPASDSLIGILKNRYGRDLIKEVRALEKLYFKYKKSILDLDFLISCRMNRVFPKFLQFTVSNKQLRASKAYIFCQKRLHN